MATSSATWRSIALGMSLNRWRFQEDPGAAMESHWLGTSGNEILKQMLKNPGMDIQEEIASLLEGGSVTAAINDNVTYEILRKDKDNL